MIYTGDELLQRIDEARKQGIAPDDLLHSCVEEIVKLRGKDEEPSPAMIEAGLKYYNYWHGNKYFRDLVINLWKVMNRERGK